AAGHAQPAAERRSQALLALGQAWLEAEAEQPEAARRLLEEAEAELADAKLRLWWEASAAWILALSGEEEAARRQLPALETGIAQFSGDPATLQLCWNMLGRTRLLLGDLEGSRAAWERYLTLDPEPAFRPAGHFFLGECHLQVGNREGARAAYEAAIAPG